jgi:hypothetical protein
MLTGDDGGGFFLLDMHKQGSIGHCQAWTDVYFQYRAVKNGHIVSNVRRKIWCSAQAKSLDANPDQ